MIRIGINGFGRIGRISFRIACENENVEVVAINDLLKLDQLAYLLKYDSVHGKFPGDVKLGKDELIVDGKSIRVTSERNPENLKWDEMNVDVVLDCTGLFKEVDSASAHLRAGAKKVVISAPSNTAKMFVMGVNHSEITNEDQVISCASCTTNCLAPMVKVLNDHLGIVEGFMTTVHASTGSQLTVDGPKSNYRSGRSAINNIIPATTGAAKAVSKVIPELNGKLTGMAFRVPIADVSVVDLTVRTKDKTSLENINTLFKNASNGSYKGIINYVEDDVVSQDFVSEPIPCNYDSKASMALNDNFFKLVAWYDNEYGYSNKLIELSTYFAML
jgi:glyceraldehyde 3-phosphate dehydrogenase